MPPSAAPPVVRLLRLTGFPLLRQLCLEEALFRSHPGNWFVINDGVAEPTIVLGISGKPQELVNLRAAHAAGVPLVRRFTGGGTVVVDADSVLTSIIVHGPSAVPHVPAYPRPIMEWTEAVYGSFLRGAAPGFALQENDYAVGPRKFGGNAQAISKDRWLHHTSFLWDYAPQRMALLKRPAKAPEYRAGRDHGDFVAPLRAVGGGLDRGAMVDGLAGCLEAHGFRVEEGRLEEAEDALERQRDRLIGSRLLEPREYLHLEGQ